MQQRNICFNILAFAIISCLLPRWSTQECRYLLNPSPTLLLLFVLPFDFEVITLAGSDNPSPEKLNTFVRDFINEATQATLVDETTLIDSTVQVPPQYITTVITVRRRRGRPAPPQEEPRRRLDFDVITCGGSSALDVARMEKSGTDTARMENSDTVSLEKWLSMCC